MKDTLDTMLRQLRLSGLAGTLDVRLQEAAGHQLSHAEFLELILQDELLIRSERLIQRRVKAAQFRELKPLELHHSNCTSKHSFQTPGGSAYSVCRSLVTAGVVASAAGRRC